MRVRKPCERCGGRGLIHWHPHWDRGHVPCPVCTEQKTEDQETEKEERNE